MSREKVAKMKTGISGLDDVLRGGFPLRRLYLVQGAPGSGKTTLALQFLLEGARNGERVLYISLSETREEIEEVATSHGWSLDGLEIVELSAIDGQLSARPVILRAYVANGGDSFAVLPGGLTAKIAVLGPMRMQYEKVMGAVLHIGREFTDVG